MKSLREFREKLRSARADFELRHRPSPFGIALFDSIHHVPRDAWERIVLPERLLLRPVYLAALEAAGGKDLKFRYAMLYRDRDPVAVVATQIHEFSTEALGSRRATTPEKREAQVRRIRRSLERALLTATDRIALRILVCGNAFQTGEHGFCQVPDLDPAEAFHGLAAHSTGFDAPTSSMARSLPCWSRTSTRHRSAPPASSSATATASSRSIRTWSCLYVRNGDRSTTTPAR